MWITSPTDLRKWHSELKLGERRYFVTSELDCPHCTQIKLHVKVYFVLHKLREHLGKPVIVTSGYRCPTYNQRVGGVKNSAHTKGYAVDIRCGDSRTRLKVVRFLLDSVFTLPQVEEVFRVQRIGLAEDFIHFDLDPDKPKGVIWVYGSRRHIA